MTRKLDFIILGNKSVGKTKLTKVLTKNKSLALNPTSEFNKYTGSKVKLLSSRKSSIFTWERWRKYKVQIVDTPGSFAERRSWREAFKKTKKPVAVVFVINPYQPIPETKSALEEVYNQYLESISNNIEKADIIASSTAFLLLIVINLFDSKGRIDETVYFDTNLKEIISKMRIKIPLMLVDHVSFDFNKKPMDKFGYNSVLERIKRFRYDQKKIH